jgi:hypothetical protein
VAIDWLRIVTGVKEVVVAGSAATGAAMAVRGVNAWKRQLVEGADWDIDRSLLRSV